MTQFHPRHPIARARFFLSLAVQCEVSQRDEFEAFLEASIVFARAAIHRLKSEYENHPDWKSWWYNLKSDPDVTFFRFERNQILKEGPPKIGQIVGSVQSPEIAASLYYYERPNIPATVTVERHLDAIEKLVSDAESRFGSVT